MIQNWRERQNNPTRFFLPVGEDERLEYMLKIDDDGCECLYCSGKHNQYALIQSHRESCDLSLILQNLDPNAISSAVSTYTADDILNSGITDYSSMPQDLGSMFNLVRQGENLFNGLPEDVRREFNYSVKNFVSKFGTLEFTNIVNKYMHPQSLEDGAFVAPSQQQEQELQQEPKKKVGRPKKEVTDNESN